MKVAIVGGTGAFGRALARKLRSLDHEVYIGSRDAQRGRERALELGVQGGREQRSLAEEVSEIVRGPVASGLQSLSAAHLAAPELPDEDALICGDDPRAKELALDLASRLVGGRAVDVGPLANSRALEAMTAVILNVNREFGVTAGLRLTGLP